MELKEMIYKRKSVRSYLPKPVEPSMIQHIENSIETLKPLYPNIAVKAEIVEKEQVKCILPWVTKQVISIYSQEKDGYLENVGFIFQQLDLYLQSIGLGVCWLGMGKLNPNKVEAKKDMKFVMMLAFGYPKGEALREDGDSFKRKKLIEISDQEDERLEVARLAPSSVNSQPWYFVHEGETIHTYGSLTGIFKRQLLSDMNRIDIGIALAHLYVANKNTFTFFKTNVKALKGYEYIGSFKL